MVTPETPASDMALGLISSCAASTTYRGSVCEASGGQGGLSTPSCIIPDGLWPPFRPLFRFLLVRSVRHVQRFGVRSVRWARHLLGSVHVRWSPGSILALSWPKQAMSLWWPLKVTWLLASSWLHFGTILAPLSLILGLLASTWPYLGRSRLCHFGGP